MEENPYMSLRAMRKELKKYWGIEVDNRRLWRARLMARKKADGDHGASFSILRWYANNDTRTYHSSSALINNVLPIVNESSNENPLPLFKRMFACFAGVRCHGSIVL